MKLWLKAPIEERDGDGKRRMVGGKKNKRDTPQGGVEPTARQHLHKSISEALASRRMWPSLPCSRGLLRRLRHPQLQSCGEDMTWTKGVMTKLGLTLNEGQDLAERC